MLKSLRISSGVLPLIMLATVLQPTSLIVNITPLHYHPKAALSRFACLIRLLVDRDTGIRYARPKKED